MPKQSNLTAPLVVALGGKQYLAGAGDELTVEKVARKPGESFEVKDLISNKKVVVKVVGEQKGPKISILKFKHKTRYLRRIGHRQKYTRVQVESTK